MLLGLFEKPYTGNHPDRFMRPDALSAARQLAAESMVLQNDSIGILPLNGVGRIAVIDRLRKAASLQGSWNGRGVYDETVTLSGYPDRFVPEAEIRLPKARSGQTTEV